MGDIPVDSLLLHVLVVFLAGISFVSEDYIRLYSVSLFYRVKYGDKLVYVVGSVIDDSRDNELFFGRELRIVSVSPVLSFHLHEAAVLVGGIDPGHFDSFFRLVFDFFFYDPFLGFDFFLLFFDFFLPFFNLVFFLFPSFFRRKLKGYLFPVVLSELPVFYRIYFIGFFHEFFHLFPKRFEIGVFVFGSIGVRFGAIDADDVERDESEFLCPAYDLYEYRSEKRSFFRTEPGDSPKVRLVVPGKKHEGEIRLGLCREFPAGEGLIHVSVEKNLHHHERVIGGSSAFGVCVAGKKRAEIESVDDLVQDNRFVSFSEIVEEAWRKEKILCLIVGFEHGLGE